MSFPVHKKDANVPQLDNLVCESSLPEHATAEKPERRDDPKNATKQRRNIQKSSSSIWDARCKCKEGETEAIWLLSWMTKTLINVPEATVTCKNCSKHLMLMHTEFSPKVISSGWTKRLSPSLLFYERKCGQTEITFYGRCNSGEKKCKTKFRWFWFLSGQFLSSGLIKISDPGFGQGLTQD